MENLDDNKTRSSSSRIPSPSSISSAHSVRPLEWDSGADIGYDRKTLPNLSTVERMALVRSTVNHLESCQAPSLTEKFNTPLAHSSPRTAVSSAHEHESSYQKNNELPKPLVDYTIHSDESFNSYFKNVSSNCRSLEDIRYDIRKSNQSSTHRRSQSINNIAAVQKTSGHLSGSSATTIMSSHKYSNKAVQVNESSLNSLKPTSSKSHSLTSSDIYHLTKSSNNPTYTVDNVSRNTSLSDESYNGCPNQSHSNANSSDRGSFEYVPGSIYDVADNVQRSNITSDSEVNTLCSEVVDGVELITRYVNNLRVSNRSRVIRKIGQTLTKNLNNLTSSKSDVALNNDVDLFDGSSKELEKQSDRSQSSRNKDKRSQGRLLTKETCVSSDIPTTQSSIRDSISIRGVSQTVSSRTTHQSNSELASTNYKSSEYSANMHPLKEFLAKEHDTQLLWLKSGIDHLNNLKRLYESQRRLKKNIYSMKKLRSEHTILTSTERYQSKELPASQLRKQASSTSENSRLIKDVERSNSLSSKISQQESSKMSSVWSDESALRTNRKTRTRSSTDHGKRERWLNSVENKENISQNQAQSQLLKTRPKCKSPISYTVIFDRKPSVINTQHYMIKEEKTIRKCVHKEYSKRNICGGKSEDSLTKRGFTLQDFLQQNKPEYVNKAECRRQCLEEIAKLRSLRDKSREELLNVLQNENDKVQCSVPPPLSVVRIFDDKTIKQQTSKKYQQLPEVQNKKLELKRKESYRRNQIMAKVFTKRLQKKVLKGQVNLNNNANVISI